MPVSAYPEFLHSLRGKRCAVLGAGISNRPLIRLLLQQDCELSVFDRSDSAETIKALDLIEAERGHFQRFLGADYLESLKNYDYIFKTPVVRPDIPELLEERRRGAVITSEMEVFLRFCPAVVIGITGSDGKSTTSALIAEILKEAGKKVYLGGNIGTPLLTQLEDMREDDFAVVELSSFQLMSMNISPHRSVLTNISPNHLDVHKDYDEYIRAKKNIFLHQSFDDILILNGRSPILSDFPLEAESKIIWTEERPYGNAPLYGLEEDRLFYQKAEASPREVFLHRSDLLIPGRYNALNVLSAAAAVEGYASLEAIQNAVRHFKGLEHRSEWVRELDGVTFFDSSIDSSPLRSRNTLSAFSEQGSRVFLITGGKDKNCDYSGLGAAIASCCQKVYLCGQNAPQIHQSILAEAPDMPVQAVRDYPEALRLARHEAKAGDVVLLSPAGTSFDRYKNFMERGDDFKKSVMEL